MAHKLYAVFCVADELTVFDQGACKDQYGFGLMRELSLAQGFKTEELGRQLRLWRHTQDRSCMDSILIFEETIQRFEESQYQVPK